MKKYDNQFWIHSGPMSNRLDITVNKISEKFFNDLGNFSQNTKQNEEESEFWSTELDDSTSRIIIP